MIHHGQNRSKLYAAIAKDEISNLSYQSCAVSVHGDSYLLMWPEGWVVGMRNALDDGSHKTSIQSFLQIHLLHRLHCLPLSQFHFQLTNS